MFFFKVLCPSNRTSELIVGSIKTNIGHAEAAAGVAGLIKVVLSMNNNTIPQHLQLSELNPHLPDMKGRISIPSKASLPWNKGSFLIHFKYYLNIVTFHIVGRRIAGVSSFGFSGTNAHAILEDYTREHVPNKAVADLPRAHILPISLFNGK